MRRCATDRTEDENDQSRLRLNWEFWTVEVLGDVSSKRDAYAAHWMPAPSNTAVQDVSISPPTQRGSVTKGTWVKIGARCSMQTWKDNVVEVGVAFPRPT